MNYDVVVLAAGQGKRMLAGKNKMLLDLLGMPIIVHTLLVFEKDPFCERITLVANRDDYSMIAKWMDTYNITKVAAVTEGGKERQDSVYQGLTALSHDPDSIILIHDGARPLITHSEIHQVVEAAERDRVAILAVPVKDTIKQVRGMKVEKTMDRSSLWMVQTPQAFRFSAILSAHHYAKEHQLDVTDDASMMEALNEEVTVVTGKYRNIKLTTPEDLLVAEQFMHDRRDRI